MKPVSHYLVFSLAIGALALQGCAQTGSTRPDAVQAANAPSQAAGATAASAAVIPEDAKGKPVVKGDTKDDFEAIVAAINQQMQPGGRWQFVDKKERATIAGAFADMQPLYDKFGSVDKMDQAAKVRLFADQSTVNAILTKRDGDRLICQSELPVGSHLPVKTCKTYAQIQAEQRNTQRFFREMAPTPQKKSGH